MGFWASLKALFEDNQHQHSASSEAFELLESLRQRRTPVCVKLAGQKYSTYVLAVRPKKGDRALRFDELMPLEGNALAQRIGKLRFEVRGDGDAAKFEVKISSFEEGMYYCPLPKKVQVSSQRNSRRISLKNVSLVGVEIVSEGRKLIRGHLTDASEHGVQIQIKLSERVLPPLVEGEIIDGIHLQLKGGQTLQLSVELRRIQIKQSQQLIYVGAKIREFKDKHAKTAYMQWLLKSYRQSKNK